MAEFINLDILGIGGFGMVVKCQRKDDGSLFAKKVLATTGEEAIERFAREVRILSKLSHPRIIKIEAAHLDEAPYWYVMPLYRSSLRALMPQMIGDRERISSVFLAITEGMEYAHQQGVIHRDLKPENVLMNDDSDLVISDFGLGRAIDAETSRMTTTGDMLGTMGYMAPEQFGQAKHADARTDIFALGRLLYELHTGERPGAVQDLKSLPPGVAAIVDRCTATDPNRRFQSIRELRDAFELIGRRKRTPTSQEQLDQLVGEVLAQGYPTVEQTQRLADLIAQCQEDQSLLHDCAVKLPAEVFAALYQHNPDVARILVKGFADTARSQGWPFEYTDRIGSACSRFFDIVDDPEIRAMVTATALDVGVSHNRYYVMDVAARLISDVKEEVQARTLAHALAPIANQLSAIEGRVKLAKLHPLIRDLFPPTEER
jgi:hypothetical protein